MRCVFAIKELKKTDNLGRMRFRLAWRDEFGHKHDTVMAGVVNPVVERFTSLGYRQITLTELEADNG